MIDPRLEDCDGWELVKSTYETNGERYRVRIWKTLPGGNVPTGATGWGNTLSIAITDALERYERKAYGSV